VDAILKYDLRKHIRLGLAQPIPGQKNECLSLTEVREIAKTFRNQLDLLEKHRITLGFDCGMPMCVFSDEDLGRLFKLNRGKILFSCSPAIDIGPDLQVWACFPLSNYEKKSLYDFDSVDEIRHYFAETQKAEGRREKAESRKGIFEECENCVHLEEKLCGGGCLAHLIKN
jgi:radical SAM protein with 4Fe4S-binding SPASM domain